MAESFIVHHGGGSQTVPLVLYLGGYENTGVAGTKGFVRTGGSLNKGTNTMTFNSTSAGTSNYATPDTAIDLTKYNKILFHGRANFASTSHPEYYQFGISTGKGSGSMSAYNIPVSTTQNSTIKIDLKALNLTEPVYPYIKSAGGSNSPIEIIAIIAY